MFVALFHAAALLDGDLRMVARWVFADDTEAREVLARSGAHQMAASLLELHNAPAEKTASVFRMVMTNALSFMSDPMLASCVLPHAGTGFDIREFIRSGGTLYLIATGDQEQSPLAPLFATLVNEIKYEATLMAQETPGGRLDPPLGFFLDEVTQIAPVPLNKWLASVGGMGIEIFPVVHGEAQLRERWQDNGAQVIMDTCGAKMLFPGITDPDTLRHGRESLRPGFAEAKGRERRGLFQPVRHYRTGDGPGTAEVPDSGHPRRAVAGHRQDPHGVAGARVPGRQAPPPDDRGPDPGPGLPVHRHRPPARGAAASRARAGTGR